MNTLLQWLLAIALTVTLLAGAANWYKTRLLTLTTSTVSRLH